MRSWAFLLTLAVTTSASGQTIYKCVVDRRVQYSDVPCQTGIEAKRMAPDGGPTQEDVARARMRAQRDLAEQRQKERAAQLARDSHHEAQRNAGLTRDLAQFDAKREALENEKITTHDISGWDRKPRAQVAAEELAKQHARAQARAGGTYDPSKAVPQSVASAKWGDEAVTANSISGWSKKSRRQQVYDSAKRAYEDEVDLIETERRAAEEAAQRSRKTTNWKSPWVTDQKGTTWWVRGNEASDGRGRNCDYHAGTNSISCR